MIAPTPSARKPLHRPARDIPVACALLALVVGGFMLTLPHYLFGVRPFAPAFDGGVYYSSTASFVHGSVPYRDFALVQPPGILIELAPIALLGRLIGSADAMAIIRLLSLVLAAANAGLAAFALRSRGRLAMAVAGVAMAAFPLSATNYQSLRLEPSMIFFCLIGIVLAFDRTGGLASRRRLLLAGVSIGFATDIKLWSVPAGIALVVACWKQWPQLRAAGAGLIGSIVVVMGPFFVIAPVDMYREMVSLQLDRHTVLQTTLVERLAYIYGLSTSVHPTRLNHVAGLLALITVVAVVVCLAVFWRRLARIEWFVLISTTVVIGSLLKTSQFYDYYAYATAGFMALLIGVTASRCSEGLRRLVNRHRTVKLNGWGLPVRVTGLAVVASLGIAGVVFESHTTRVYLTGTTTVSPDISAIIPAGSCVLSDNPALPIEANRPPTARKNCPAVIDPQSPFLLTERVTPPGIQPFPQALLDPWLKAFAHADYVVQDFSYSNYIPWNAELYAAFNRQFILLDSAPGTYIYGRRH